MTGGTSQFLEVEDCGQIGAGTVVAFTPKGKRWIAPPKDVSPYQPFITYTVSGNSLIGRGIENGDTLICRTCFEISEIKEETVCVLLIRETELTVKMLSFNDDGTITLRSANPVFADKTFLADEVEIKAIVCELQRKT